MQLSLKDLLSSNSLGVSPSLWIMVLMPHITCYVILSLFCPQIPSYLFLLLSLMSPQCF